MVTCEGVGMPSLSCSGRWKRRQTVSCCVHRLGLQARLDSTPLQRCLRTGQHVSAHAQEMEKGGPGAGGDGWSLMDLLLVGFLRDASQAALGRHANPQHDGTERGSFENALILLDLEAHGIRLALDAHEGRAGHEKPGAEEGFVAVLLVR